MIKKILVLIDIIREDNSILFVQAFSFSLLMSLAPLLTIFVIAFRQFALDTDLIIRVISAYLPMEEVMSFINYINNTNTTELVSLIVLLATTLYLSSRSVNSFLKFSSNLEDANYPGWYLRILAIFGQLLFIIIIIVLVLIVSFVNSPTLRYLLVPASMFFGFLIYYRNLSLKHRQIKDHWRGAFLTTMILSLMGVFFSFYINNFTNYESLYGPLASLMIVLLAIYVVAYIIFVGYLLNFVYFDSSDQTEHLTFYGKIDQFIQSRKAKNKTT